MIEQGQINPPRTVNNQILAIGGGKGGTGKSFIAASMAIGLADRGNEILLIDADLGTANLHTFLGIEPPKLSLSDFITKKRSAISNVIMRTGIKNLHLISGANDMVGITNLAYVQKLKILNHIKKLNYEHILLDLGPGTSFNTLDFFLIAHCGILITSPEPTSIENTYRFTKGLLFRHLRQVMNKKLVKAIIDKGIKQRNGYKFETIFDFLEAIEKVEPRLGDTIASYISSLHIKLIVNQVRTGQDRTIGRKMATAARKHFGIPIDFLGNIGHDEKISNGLLQRKPLMTYLPYSQAFKELTEIIHKISPRYQLGLGFFAD